MLMTKAELAIDHIANLHGTDGNEACHAFWDECGSTMLMFWKAAEVWHESNQMPIGVRAWLTELNEKAWAFRERA